MDDELKIKLANALDIEPDQIMEYGPDKDGRHAVILWNFQKFPDVEPKEVSPVPPELRATYQKPSKANKAQLFALADALDLQTSSKMTKKELIALIYAYQNPQSATVPELPAAPKADQMQAHAATNWSADKE